MRGGALVTAAPASLPRARPPRRARRPAGMRGPFKGRGRVAARPLPAAPGRWLKGPRPGPPAECEPGRRAGQGVRPGERAGWPPLRTMYTITKGPSKLVAQRRTGPSQQQVESRLGELLKCRQAAPPTPPPPRAQPPGPWPLSSGPLSQGGPPSGGGAPEPRKASRPAGPRVPGGVARAAQDSRLPPPASGAEACVQSGEWPAAPCHISIP
uniref:MAPK regulated corepressor interacting protein 2 n=1 Tax=Suricata suricatta TaxID=37032 RepID=A0A673U0M5_SURSU